jgi:hypothetical protein
MEQDQKELYLAAISGALALAMGDRNEDYNKGGIKLRDYWAMNGIRSPLQMVDMKLKRALSQVGTWDHSFEHRPVPKDIAQVAKMAESMIDLINYAAFVVCEAATLYKESQGFKGVDIEKQDTRILPGDGLRGFLEDAIERWHSGKTGGQRGV